MDFVQMDYFIVAAKNLSFTKAANLLYLTQPALSQQIIRMEKELGLKLFSRGTRSLSLTPAGKVLLEEFEKIYHQYNNALMKARGANNNLEGLLRIGLLDGVEITPILTKVLQAMNQIYPKIDLSLFSFCYEELAQRLYEGRLDVAFTKQFDAESRADFSFQVVLPCRECIAVPVSNPLSGLDEAELKDFRDELFIVISETDHDISLDKLLAECQKNGFNLRYKPSPSYYASLQWVRAGLAVLITDENSVLKDENDIRLLPLKPFRNSDTVLEWYTQNNNPLLQPFLDVVADSLGLEFALE